MENNEKIAVIGSKDSILVFKSVGCDIFGVDGEEKTRSTLNRVMTQYKMVLITDDYAKYVEDIVHDSLLKPYPLILVIPSGTNQSNYALDRISESVERALGVNILLNKEK